MSTPFGGFVHRSPLSSLPHDPPLTLASNCIRDYFGPTVQTVADCLQRRGGASTVAQVIASIRGECRRVWNEERERLVTDLIRKERTRNSDSRYKIHRAKGPEQAGFVVEAGPIRAALLTLVQHSMVKVHIPDNTAINSVQATKRKNNAKSVDILYKYSLDVDRARLLPRYPRYVEYVKKALDENAAALVEELCINGRMTTYDAVSETVNSIIQADDESVVPTVQKGVVESFVRMIQGGFIELAPSLIPDKEDDGEEQEAELDDVEPPEKKRKLSKDQIDVRVSCSNGETPAILSLLKKLPFRKHFPPDAVWRINVRMCNDHIRSFCLGRLVAERFGHKVQNSGSIVTAALKFAAHNEHALKIDNIESRGVFTPEDILRYLPAPVKEVFEKKAGGAISNLSNALVELSEFSWPSVLMEVESAEGHPKGGKFEMATTQLVTHLRGRILHQMTLDSHGEVASRICSILEAKGHQESESIAEAAMTPAKDVREVLHRLYKENFISLLTLQQTKQHNPASALYLWSVDKSRLTHAVNNKVCTALFHIRLRRQHEVDMGSRWMDRAKDAGDRNENLHKDDKVKSNQFAQGLERLDNAALQLDETLMVLKDF